MQDFAKLHGTILDSSVWSEPHHVRIVWITMLAMANWDGVVEASVGGLARRAVVTRKECEEALQVFLSPDPDSRDGTSGERIEKVPGGWLVLNHENYRNKQTREQRLTAERVRRHREKQKATGNAGNVTCNDVTTDRDIDRDHRSRSKDAAASLKTDQVIASGPVSGNERAAAASPNSNPKALSNTPTQDPAHTTENATASGTDAAIDISEPKQLTSLKAALAIPAQERSRSVLAHSSAADYTSPQEWPEVVEIARAVHAKCGWSAPRLGSYSRDSGVRAVVELLAAGFVIDEILAALVPLTASEWWTQRRRTLSSLTPPVIQRAVDESTQRAPRDPAYAERIARGRARLAQIDAEREAANA